jgi:hypothetical protein
MVIPCLLGEKKNYATAKIPLGTKICLCSKKIHG